MIVVGVLLLYFKVLQKTQSYKQTNVVVQFIHFLIERTKYIYFVPIDPPQHPLPAEGYPHTQNSNFPKKQT